MKLYKCPLTDAREIYHYSVITLYENVVSKKLKMLNCSLKTYLFAIGRKKYLEKLKSERRFEKNLPEDALAQLPERQSDDVMVKERRLEKIERCLQQLGEPGRTILELYYYHGKSMQEIAMMLNYKNSATAKNLKYKCLNRLKKIVFQEEPISRAHQFA
jgi:RNA polymerase sigma-70 factor (ECF subfamily)